MTVRVLSPDIRRKIGKRERWGGERDVEKQKEKCVKRARDWREEGGLKRKEVMARRKVE